jgi:hypothetical protein
MKPSVIDRRSFVRFSLVTGATAFGGAGWTSLVRAASGDSPPAWRFSPERDFKSWQTGLRRRLVEILALSTEGKRALDAVVERESENDRYVIDRIRFTAEPGESVPGFLLRPKGASRPQPVMICLQGHSPGMHISIGQARNDREKGAIAGGRDLALQAVGRGWAALVIEQRGFGERAERNVTCNEAALRALHRGRPLTGQRVFDVMRAIDFIGTQPTLDAERIGCVGNSTGGTVSFYAACIDPRISLAVVSCSFCTFEDSWLSLPHCACGYLPGVMQAADMPDLAGLIAPRRLLLVAGKQDNLARFEGVEQGFRRAKEIFTATGSPNHLRLVAGEGGHQFYPELAWPVVAEMMTS